MNNLLKANPAVSSGVPFGAEADLAQVQGGVGWSGFSWPQPAPPPFPQPMPTPAPGVPSPFPPRPSPTFPRPWGF